MWAGKLVELEGGSGSSDVGVFEIGPDVWAGVLVEVVVQPGAGLWLEAVIGDVALAEILVEIGSGV